MGPVDMVHVIFLFCLRFLIFSRTDISLAFFVVSEGGCKNVMSLVSARHAVKLVRPVVSVMHTPHQSGLYFKWLSVARTDKKNKMCSIGLDQSATSGFLCYLHINDLDTAEWLGVRQSQSSTMWYSLRH